jgi:hypothetical protein
MDDFEGTPGPPLVLFESVSSLPMMFLTAGIVIQALYIYCMFSGCMKPFSQHAAQHLT